MLRVALSLTLCLLWVDTVAAKWRQVEPGLRAQVIQSKGASWGSSKFHVYQVDLSVLQLVALDAREQLGKPKGTVQELGRQRGALLAVNGTYFDERDRPLGLLLDERGQRNPLRKADWGVFYIKEQKAHLVHTTDWKHAPPKNVEFAIQVGPRCVVDGKQVRLKSQTARRAALGIMADGKVVIAVTAQQTASAELASFMGRSQKQGGLGCTQAVMLDGGGSAALWSAEADASTIVPGLWPVPTGVGVVRRVRAQPVR